MGKLKTSKSASPEFLGSIVDSAVDTLTADFGVKGARQVWFPKSKADVANAVAHLRDQAVVIRSGIQTAATDAAETFGGIVIHLARLTEISAQEGSLTAEAGATTIAVAEQLYERNRALPLIDNPHKSIVANVLDDSPSCLIRTLGSLSDYVTKISGVTPDGQTIDQLGKFALKVARGENAVITEVTFELAPADDLWLVRKSFLYPGKERFAALISELFLNTRIPERCDIVLDAVSSRHDIPVVTITTAGSGANVKKAASTLVETAIATLPAGLVSEISTEDHDGSNVVRTLVGTGIDLPHDPEVDAHRIHRIVEPQENLNEFLNHVVEDVDRGLAFRSDGTGKRDENLRLFVRLQSDRKARLILSGVAYTSRPSALAIPVPLASVPFRVRSETLLHPGAEFALAQRIPGFRGMIYEPTDLLYEFHTTQYASSSHKREEMTPFMVAYPRDVNDIKAALTFARSKQKHVVARSGGHQYSGLSSGGDGTIVLAMDQFDHFIQISDHVFDIGPSVPLTKLARIFKEHDVSIPHGECPLVCIGGHAQTGGYGHMVRSFGLTLDYVKAFTIVLSDGTERTIQRPTGAPVTDDDRLFWGVLGGNAGSFGIITSYRIECIKDTDHPNSYGYAAIRVYRKERYENLMKQVQLWTQGIAAGTLRPDIEFQITVMSKSDTLRPPFPTLLVELVHANLGGPDEVVDAEQIFAPIMDAADSEPRPLEIRLTHKGTQSLSKLADSFVRRFPLMTLNGREFRQPYKKRVNCTSSSLTDSFIAGFVQLIDKVVSETQGVYVSSQMVMGGGRLRNSPRRAATSIPRRDFVYCFTFDLFYDEGKKQVAEQLQDEMQNLINVHFSPGQEQRLFWGSFGDTNITEDSVRNFYYDDAAVYTRLQQLKKSVDPDDLFHSSLTVKLP